MSFLKLDWFHIFHKFQSRTKKDTVGVSLRRVAVIPIGVLKGVSWPWIPSPHQFRSQLAALG